ILGGASSSVVAAQSRNTDPEALQVALDAGTYYIGVSSLDSAKTPVPTAYTLEETTTPRPDEVPGSRPILDRMVIGNITATGAQINWLTDRDAAGDVLVAQPLQQFGDPNPAKTHQVSVTGLTAGAFSHLRAISQAPGG